MRRRVLVVGEGPPAKGGVATFTDWLTSDPVLAEHADIRLLNTTRRAVRRGGAASFENVRNAAVDSARVLRMARDVDVVHVQAPFMPTLPMLRALLLCTAVRAGRAAVLCHLHTGLVNQGPHERYEPGRVQRLLLRAFRGHTLVAVSEAAADGLRPHVRGGRIVVVDNATDVDGSPVADPAASTTVVYAGALGRPKGLLDLLAAGRMLRERGITDWDLVVVGGPNQLGEAEAAIVREAFEREGFAGALVGARTPGEVRDVLAGAAVFVLPSHSEGHPLAVLEAMACGVPVVATHVGAIPDVVRDGVDGLVVPPRDAKRLADALAALLEDPALRRRMGASARARAAERFDVGTLRRRLLALYDEAGRGAAPVTPSTAAAGARRRRSSRAAVWAHQANATASSTSSDRATPIVSK